MSILTTHIIIVKKNEIVAVDKDRDMVQEIIEMNKKKRFSIMSRGMKEIQTYMKMMVKKRIIKFIRNNSRQWISLVAIKSTKINAQRIRYWWKWVTTYKILEEMWDKTEHTFNLCCLIFSSFPILLIFIKMKPLL